MTGSGTDRTPLRRIMGTRRSTLALAALSSRRAAATYRCVHGPLSGLRQDQVVGHGQDIWAKSFCTFSVPVNGICDAIPHAYDATADNLVALPRFI